MEFWTGVGIRDLAADAKAHDAWFRAKVLEALDDDRPAAGPSRFRPPFRKLVVGHRRLIGPWM